MNQDKTLGDAFVAAIRKGVQDALFPPLERFEVNFAAACDRLELSFCAQIDSLSGDVECLSSQLK